MALGSHHNKILCILDLKWLFGTSVALLVVVVAVLLVGIVSTTRFRRMSQKYARIA